jgi:hypothetical protein
LSYFSITGILLIISILGLYLNEWHTAEYAKVHSLTLKGKNIDQWLELTILGLIALSIVLELFKAAIEILRFKKRSKKYHDIDPYLQRERAKMYSFKPRQKTKEPEFNKMDLKINQISPVKTQKSKIKNLVKERKLSKQKKVKSKLWSKAKSKMGLITHTWKKKKSKYQVKKKLRSVLDTPDNKRGRIKKLVIKGRSNKNLLK